MTELLHNIILADKRFQNQLKIKILIWFKKSDFLIVIFSNPAQAGTHNPIHTVKTCPVQPFSMHIYNLSCITMLHNANACPYS